MKFRSDIETLILASLEKEAKFGFDIARHIRARSKNGLKLGEGQLYPILHRLQRQGMVAAEWEMPEGETPRKVYSLTPEGKKRLADGRKSWKAFVSSVESVIGPVAFKEPSHG
jgi:DNA-binding PadR family transcriptional regulator